METGVVPAAGEVLHGLAAREGDGFFERKSGKRVRRHEKPMNA